MPAERSRGRQDSHLSTWITGIVAAALVVAIWTSTVYNEVWGHGRFESINALFAGLAFSALLVAILLQRKELMLQREELEDTREELKGQKEQLALQNTTMKKQSFETTFFQLLSLHHDIVRSMNLTPHTSTHGRGSFEILYSFLRQEAAHPPPQAANQETRQQLSLIYRAFSRKYQVHVGHYFRNLYHIVTFVDRSEVLSKQEKRLYTTFVRAQLSSFELLLLFYNCLADGLGSGEFNELVHKYALLKNLTTMLLIDETAHKPLFSASAYEWQSEEAIAT